MLWRRLAPLLVCISIPSLRASNPPSFRNDIIPAITKLGCNSGACHGSQYGKGGFKLSLLGFDADSDYEAIVKDLKGRRVNLSDPADSLILRKPTLSIPHEGGRRFAPASETYNLMLRWIAGGVPPPRSSDPILTGLTADPPLFAMKANETGQLRVVARYNDGSTRDVTSSARLEILNDGVASVSSEGVVTAKGGGRGAVLSRYMGQAAVSTLLVPFRENRGDLTFPGNNYIDEAAVSNWKKLGLVPVKLSSDTQFLRRVYLDLIGVLPREEEVRAFVADPSEDKRSEAINRLLDRPEYVDFWTLRWGDLLRITRLGMGEKPMWNFNHWVRRNLSENRPINEMVREILLARGQPNNQGPAAFYKMMNSPEEAAEAVSITFMGLRMGCAKCHQHPFEKWGQRDYYGMAAFFARIDSKPDSDYGASTLRLKPTGFVRHPKTREIVHPTIPEGDSFAYEGDLRIKLADWLTSRNNPWLARNFVNRYWGYLMGRGLVEPLDDIRATNPPSMPDLLDALARDFRDSGFDQKHLLRTIANSRVYQLDSEPLPENPPDNMFYTFYSPRRLMAEQLLEAVYSVTRSRDKFASLPADIRPIQLPDPEVPSYFLHTFGRPRRLIPCECSRNNETNITQVLTLLNGEYLQEKIASPEGRVAVLSELLPPGQIVTNLYYAAFGREPSAKEMRQAMDLLNASESKEARRRTFEDLLWALLNSREFFFNH